MRAFRRVAGQLPQVPPYRFHLPDESFARFRVALGHREHPAHQAGHEVGAERKAGRRLPLVLALPPGSLEEWRVDKDILGGPELTEELLGRVQCAVSFQYGR